MPQTATAAIQERDPGAVSTSQDPPPVVKDGRDWVNKEPAEVSTTQPTTTVPTKDGKDM